MDPLDRLMSRLNSSIAVSCVIGFREKLLRVSCGDGRRVGCSEQRAPGDYGECDGGRDTTDKEVHLKPRSPFWDDVVNEELADICADEQGRPWMSFQVYK